MAKISKLKASYKLKVESWEKLRKVLKVEKSLEILVTVTIYKLKVDESWVKL